MQEDEGINTFYIVTQLVFFILYTYPILQACLRRTFTGINAG